MVDGFVVRSLRDKKYVGLPLNRRDGSYLYPSQVSSSPSLLGEGTRDESWSDETEGSSILSDRSGRIRCPD